MRKAHSVVAVEGAQVGEQPARAHVPGQRRPDPTDDALEEYGVEPHVRVRAEPLFLPGRGVERKV